MSIKISISGKGLELGESLQDYVRDHLNGSVPKYLDTVNAVDVVFSKESHLFSADITLSSGTHAHLVLRGRASAGDIYAAFDQAAARIEKQLRRYKRRLSDRHAAKPSPGKQEEAARMEAVKYIIGGDQDIDELPVSNDPPLVIAEKQTMIETLTVSDAVMRMDLSDLPALLFINAGNDRLNVVYRRTDGNISWVDPVETAQAALPARKAS